LGVLLMRESGKKGSQEAQRNMKNDSLFNQGTGIAGIKLKKKTGY